MRSPKGVWLATAAIICIVTGLLTGSGEILALSLPIMMYLAILSMLLEQDEVEIRLQRSVSDSRIVADELISVEVTVENNGPGRVLLEVVDPLPAHVLLTEGDNRALMYLDAGEGKTFTYTLKCPVRGRYVFEGFRLKLMDPGQLTSAESSVSVRSEFSVVAKPESAKGIKIAPRKTRNWVGMIKSRRVGIGTEFFGIRDYVTGDEMRKINWKASARYDALLTNEYEGECSGDVTMILDARAESNVGRIENCTVEQGIRALSTIAAQVLRDKNRVGLIVLRDVIDEVYPAFGKRQFYRLSERLLDVRPTGLLPFDSVDWMVRSHFPLESQIILVSALTDPEIVKTIGNLCARGFDVVVLSPCPIRTESDLAADSPEKDLAMRILVLERQNLISELRRFARIIDWNPTEPLVKALKGVEASAVQR
jgi:uncharacterized protein (DUF58 family)